MKTIFKPKISSSFVILILLIQGLAITLLFILDKVAVLSKQPFLSTIMVNLFLPILTTLIINFIDKYVIFREPKIISEHTGGFKGLTDLDLNFSKPLKMVFTNIDKNFIPRDIFDNLNKFSSIKLVLAHSKFVSKAREFSLKKSNYYEDGLNKTNITFDYFLKKQLLKMEIVETEQNQFPFGIMIHNDNWIYFAPFWNHPNCTDGSVEGICLKIPVNSEFGRHLLDSFDSLFNEGVEIKNFDIKQVRNIGY